MNEYIITEEELNTIARFLESLPLGQSLVIYEMLRGVEKRPRIKELDVGT